MIELIGTIALALAALAGAILRGKRRKQTNFELIEGAPERVARLYLRHDLDVDADWLYARLTNGKKLCLAAPWDVEAALARLARVGLVLAPEETPKPGTPEHPSRMTPTTQRRPAACAIAP